MPPPDTAGMSIATRPPGSDLPPGSRDWVAARIAISRPPKELLPDGGTLAPAPASAPGRVLARDALQLIRIARLAVAGSPWHDAAASPEVEQIRAQLVPIRTRRALASSYRREAFHTAGPGDAQATRVAYALRWAELGGDRG